MCRNHELIEICAQTFEVAWCTKQRNNARLIPDGTITGVSFIKTGKNKRQIILSLIQSIALDAYVQVYGYGDFTRLNIPFGDFGGYVGCVSNQPYLSNDRLSENLILMVPLGTAILLVAM